MMELIKDIISPSSKNSAQVARHTANTSPSTPTPRSSRVLISRGLRVKSFKYPTAGTMAKEKSPEAEMMKDISDADFPMPVRYTESTEPNRAIAMK